MEFARFGVVGTRKNQMLSIGRKTGIGVNVFDQQLWRSAEDRNAIEIELLRSRTANGQSMRVVDVASVRLESQGEISHMLGRIDLHVAFAGEMPQP
jgi:hypothetical protein